ncbi:MAG TPA: polysaccharide deacetylase family protein [Candidatus Atribacteria bacterium]|nr:polysaccharide deacetylase family protein [Candidatus Atribacteria bacterium]
MKVIFLPYRKSILINIIVIGVIFTALALINAENAKTVFGNSIEPIYKGYTDRPVIGFECNVVWGTEYVPQLLKIFSEEGIKITFFIGGEWAKDNPELLKQIADEGHEIGNHGYGHKHHSKLDLDENIAEIQKAEDIIKSITGVKTSLFAPPYGDYSKTTLLAANSLGYKTIMWSIDTIDWRRDGVDKIIGRVIKNPQKGDLVLMHPTADTVTALPIIIQKLKHMGFEITTVSNTIKSD